MKSSTRWYTCLIALPNAQTGDPLFPIKVQATCGADAMRQIAKIAAPGYRVYEIYESGKIAKKDQEQYVC